MKKIGFITCAADILKRYFPTPSEPDFIQTDPLFTPDDQLAVNVLRQQGYEIDPVIWGAPISSLQDFDLVIVRSPWDYMHNKNNFMQWIMQVEQAGICVSNPAKFMRWLLDKHYLRHLQEMGVSVIPTKYYKKGAQINLSQLFTEQGEFILKPCISAAGIGLFHISSALEAIRLNHEVNEQLKHNDYMLQEFIPEITTHGEWSLIFLDNKYSHAVHKKPGPNSILVHAERGGSLSFTQQPSQEMIAFACATYEKVLPAFKYATHESLDPHLITYLRLDIIETKSHYVLVECEGVEPELFLRATPDAVTKFCEAIRHL